MTTERIRIGDDYYLLASAVAPSRRRKVLSHGDSFGIFDLSGDVPLAGLEPFGLFHRGTRFLDRFELRLNGVLPVLLSSSASDDGAELVSYLTNADERRGEELVLERDMVGIQRTKTLVEGMFCESIRVENFGPEPLRLEVSLHFGVDFSDMFELRGVSRSRRGLVLAPELGAGTSVCLPYRGLDDVRRETRLTFSRTSEALTESSARFPLALESGESASIEVRVNCREGSSALSDLDFVGALESVRSERRSWSTQFATMRSSNGGFNDWAGRAVADLALLGAETPGGSYVYAGIPWFATVFGRDGLITGLETLAFAPELSAGILRTLAAFQGQTSDPERDEEPGKILHEMRYGEMAALREIPFGRDYGSVDSTPLFLWLLAKYTARSADMKLVEELWPAALRAVDWIESFGDRDGDGYVEYERLGARGLSNQGWKDSRDAI